MGDQEGLRAGELGAAGLAMAKLLAVLAMYTQCLPEAVADARINPSRLLPQVQLMLTTSSAHFSKCT